MIFSPDDFADDPYQAGINQIGHMVFGAAIASIIGLLAYAVIAAWELWQYRKQGATRPDLYADLFFWSFGIWAYQVEYFNVLVILLGGLWMAKTWYWKELHDFR